MTHSVRAGDDGPCDLYRFFDVDGVLLYVGISVHAALRMLQHRREKDWWPLVARIDVEHLPDRGTAAAAELVAIRQESPRFNVAGADGSSNPTDMSSAQTNLTRNGIVGMFVLTPDKAAHFPTHQGLVLDQLDRDHYLVQWMSWWDGAWTDAEVVGRDLMVGWKFYASHDRFLAAGEMAMKRRDGRTSVTSA